MQADPNIINSQKIEVNSLKEQRSQPLLEQQKASETQQNNTKKYYYFETQTKRLKQYYINKQHQQKLVSRRILFNNNSGTVRYFGPLQHEQNKKLQQLWIGIQWDQKNRGKHNGTVKGFKYFQCLNNQGSLVKYQKIQFGYKLQTALFKRYFKSEEMHHAKNIYEQLKMYKKQIKNNAQTIQNNQNKQDVQNKQNKQEQTQQRTSIVQVKKKLHKVQYDSQAYFDSLKKTKKIMVQFIGFDQIWNKINNLDKIQSISLPECRICDLGPKGHLNELLKSLRILSLQDNLLSDYHQIYQLGYELPFLEQLSLTNNSLSQPQFSFQQLNQIEIVGHQDSKIQLIKGEPLFKNLKTLILINTGLKWRTLFKIIKAFKKIKQLVICRNQLTDYQNIDNKKTQQCLDELQFLNLQQTYLTQFKNINVFSKLPKLQRLTLNKNYFEQIKQKIQGFQKLKSLSVQNCAIRKPVVIYQISNFKNLDILNIKHNPVNELMGNSYVRFRSIAQCQKLTIINGAPLKKYQRKDSQIYYMRQTFRQYFAEKKKLDYDYDFNDFLKYCSLHHPNILLFINRYGNPYPVEEKKQIKEIIKNQVKQTQMKKGTGMVKIKIYFEQLQSTDQRKIPLTWTLASLKNFFAKTFKVPSGNQILIHRNENEKIQEQMTEDIKPLSYYNLSEDSIILVKRRQIKGGITFDIKM